MISPTISERLNKHLLSPLSAKRPFRVDDDDLILRFSPATDFRYPNVHTLSLSGGEKSINRPAYTRAILVVDGAYYPDYPDDILNPVVEVWVVHDLGLLELGGSIVTIDIMSDATFHLVFVEPTEIVAIDTVNESLSFLSAPNRSLGSILASVRKRIVYHPSLRKSPVRTLK